jgi:hypothetical protein
MRIASEVVILKLNKGKFLACFIVAGLLTLIVIISILLFLTKKTSIDALEYIFVSSFFIQFFTQFEVFFYVGGFIEYLVQTKVLYNAKYHFGSPLLLIMFIIFMDIMNVIWYKSTHSYKQRVRARSGYVQVKNNT